MLAITRYPSYTEVMKRFVIIGCILVTFLIIFSDPLLIFLLSGSLPIVNVTLPPTTMLAVIVASIPLVAALRRRVAVYHRCLKLYDELFNTTKKSSTKNPVSSSN